MTSAGVVLAGGRSTRMATDKAALAWGTGTLVAHVAGVLADGCTGPVVVVRAAGQQLPALPSGTAVVDDPRPGLGPLQGLVAGLSAVAESELAFVAATDLPYLDAGTVRILLGSLRERADSDVLAVSVDGHPQWLAAAYRTPVAVALGRALDAGERRVRTALEACRATTVDAADLGLDPLSFTNVNDPAAYARARGARRG